MLQPRPLQPQAQSAVPVAYWHASAHFSCGEGVMRWTGIAAWSVPTQWLARMCTFHVVPTVLEPGVWRVALPSGRVTRVRMSCIAGMPLMVGFLQSQADVLVGHPHPGDTHTHRFWPRMLYRTLCKVNLVTWTCVFTLSRQASLSSPSQSSDYGI